MADTVKAKALVAFSHYVSGYGIVHGDPDSTDHKARSPTFPKDMLDLFVNNGWVAGKKKPKAEDASDDDAAAAGEAPVA